MKASAHKAKKAFALAIFIITPLLGLSLLSQCNRSKSPGKSTTVRVAYAPVVLNLPAYYAQEHGLFEKRGIDVDLNVFGSANDMINAVVAGQIDAVTGVSLVPILNLEKQYPGRVRVVLHSRMTDSSPFDGIVVKSGSSIHTIAGLEGKKLGIFPGTTAHNLMRALLKKHEVDPDKVKFVQLPPPSHLTALESGSIDALLAYEPTLTTALNGGNRRIFGSIYADLLSPNPISVTILSRKFEANHPEAATAFVDALDESIRTIRDSPEKARPSLVSFTKLPPPVIPDVNIVEDSLSSEVSIKNLQAFIDLMVEIGELPATIKAEQLVH